MQTYLVTDTGDGLNRFRYADVTEADRAALDSYVAALGAIPISTYNRTEQFAYWTNLYNAVTLKVILDHFPVSSIRQIKDGPMSMGPWDRKLVTVEGQVLSLNDIEHKILRPQWRDPRVHYGVNCASVGCPNLQPEAFSGANLETMLNVAARDYVNHPRALPGVPRTFGGDRLTASRIYDWFQADFGGSDAGVIAHLRRHATDETRQLLAGDGNIEVINNPLIEDGGTIFALYQDDQLDTAGVPTAELQAILNDPEFADQLIQIFDLAVFYFAFAHDKPPFDNVHARRAFSALWTVKPSSAKSAKTVVCP
ncbi:MAG: DUF547 domain-containing protein [Rhodospirillales bacterium]|nr:DUF547 domain-containing protein [Rhodospirillales bacterium]